MNIMKKGFHYSQDGPGNRLVYHLLGCNLSCPWCANPEGMDAGGRPKGYQEMTVEEMVREAEDSKALFFDQGGITLTGGEPTMQFAEVKRLLQELKKRRIHTAMETNGTHPDLTTLAPYLNLFIVDLKHIDNEKHKKATGLENRQILKNLAALASAAEELWIRTPLIGGFNGEERNIPSFVEFYQSIPMEHVKLELLLYHEYGRDKWAMCGKEYTVKNGFVAETVREAYERAYKSCGFCVIRT